MAANAITPIAVIEKRFADPVFMERLSTLAPRNVKADQLAALTLYRIKANPNLQRCTQASILASIAEAMSLGLDPGARNQVYFIPRKIKGVDTCTLAIDYRGLMKLAKNSGDIAYIAAHVVRADDEFEIVAGEEERLSHRPKLNSEASVIASYAVAHRNDGRRQWVVCERRRLERAENAAKKSGGGQPWDSDYEAMAKKTAVRDLCKFLDSSTELQRAVAMDYASEAGESLPYSPENRLLDAQLPGDRELAAGGRVTKLRQNVAAARDRVSQPVDAPSPAPEPESPPAEEEPPAEEPPAEETDAKEHAGGVKDPPRVKLSDIASLNRGASFTCEGRIESVRWDEDKAHVVLWQGPHKAHFVLEGAEDERLAKDTDLIIFWAKVIQKTKAGSVSAIIEYEIDSGEIPY